ncbi:hypothetical protein BMAPRL20_1702 [Burkholderia mallei PRL-20]|uniref:Uncharacterized protein n=1 Tax=Burkholderia mallei (strain NCTC 10229) TaxID=412022 RepID=A2S1E2_BURM9|nr:hypothetical protein BMA10229_1965 [Burkholderia mallei NCTC 10229]ABO03328.1 hypothetical protein BMA10247_A0646 [Burkholderia mallei NCTC 10247]EDK55763.1 hypothetical protein BMAFMH_E0894 [Burkholderia mallei FMH]EDK61692.1 hypothetical protein BMAJHU_I0814 [Burkholderia mallei JHU]EDP87103.1 hypothetical protein BMA10399_B2045 [Burkholderia mallei ATCC 10399]EEP83375.1 conserved hypothetical protein [Burkholderia mallei GB8 horse 4]EES42767.1 hypothetical protein BMAPRL20_1702 [Burkhol
MTNRCPHARRPPSRGPVRSFRRLAFARAACAVSSARDRWLIGDRSGIGQRLIDGSPAWVHDWSAMGERRTGGESTAGRRRPGRRSAASQRLASMTVHPRSARPARLRSNDRRIGNGRIAIASRRIAAMPSRRHARRRAPPHTGHRTPRAAARARRCRPIPSHHAHPPFGSARFRETE